MQKHSLTFKVSAAQQVKDEFKSIRNRLQSQSLISLEQFTEFVQSENNEFNCPEGYNHIRNVFYGRAADYNLTRLIENYMISNEPQS